MLVLDQAVKGSPPLKMRLSPAPLESPVFPRKGRVPEAFYIFAPMVKNPIFCMTPWTCSY
jgi:hypothetical protein